MIDITQCRQACRAAWSETHRHHVTPSTPIGIYQIHQPLPVAVTSTGYISRAEPSTLQSTYHEPLPPCRNDVPRQDGGGLGFPPYRRATTAISATQDIKTYTRRSEGFDSLFWLRCACCSFEASTTTTGLSSCQPNASGCAQGSVMQRDLMAAVVARYHGKVSVYAEL
jgi:hypothetical protein